MEVNKKVVELSLEEILPNRFQPRIKFNEEAINELAESIKEHGVIQPIVVRPVGDKYEIIAGERRYKASTLAGKATIPAIITDLNDKDSAEVALIENVQRQNLTPIEEAISYKKILDMGYLNQTTLAEKLGKNQSTIANKLRLLELDDSVQEALLESKISERHARSLLRISNHDQQISMLNRIIDERLTVRKTDEEIDKMLNSNENNGNQDVIQPSFSEPLTIDKPLTFESFFQEPSSSSNEMPENTIIETIQPQSMANDTINPGFIDVDKIAATAQPISVQEPEKNIDMNVLVPNFNQIPQVETPEVINEEPKLEPKKFFDILGNTESNEQELPSTPMVDGNSSFNFDNLFSQAEQVPAPATSQNEIFNSTPSAENINVFSQTPEPMLNSENVNILEQQLEPTIPFITPQNDNINNVVPVENINALEQQTEPMLNSENIIPIETSNSFEQTGLYNTSDLSINQNDANPIVNMKQAINIIRECTSKLENLGYIVDSDEFDLDNMYQVIIKIDK